MIDTSDIPDLNGYNEAFAQFIDGVVTLVLGGIAAFKRIHIANGETISREILDNIPPDDCILSLLDEGIKQVFSSDIINSDMILSDLIKALNSFDDMAYDEKQHWINFYKTLLKED